MIQLQVSGIVKRAVASLTTRTVLPKKVFVHLRTGHFPSLWLAYALFDPKKRCRLSTIVCTLWRLRGVRYLPCGEQFAAMISLRRYQFFFS